MKRLLLETPYWSLEASPDDRVVWLCRSPVPFATIPEVTSANHRVIQSLSPERAGWGIIVDMRRAPARNDSQFEQAMHALRDAVETRFARTALLLATHAGVLQVQRLGREDGARAFATMSEAAALAHATGALPEQRPRMSSHPAPSSAGRAASRGGTPGSHGSVPPSRGGLSR